MRYTNRRGTVYFQQTAEAPILDFPATAADITVYSTTISDRTPRRAPTHAPWVSSSCLTFIGTLFTVAGAAFMFASADTVPAVYGQAMKAGSAYAWTRSGTFEMAFGALLVMSRSWGAEERFKIGVVTLLTLIGLLYNVIQHAASSGINKFALADPAYALVTALAVVVAAGLVVNKLEPGIFEKDKGSKGTRKSTRVRTKRA